MSNSEPTEGQKRALWNLIGIVSICVGLGLAFDAAYGFLAFGTFILSVEYLNKDDDDGEEGDEDWAGRWMVEDRWDENSRTCAACGRAAGKRHRETCPEPADRVYPPGESWG